MKKIPMLDLKLEYEYMKTDIDLAIENCLRHQQWINGAEVRNLEIKIARYLGVKHCIGVSSGTDALILALRALAIKTKRQEYFDRTDKIITTPFTFIATGEAILRAGATPVFVDINQFHRGYTIDSLDIGKYLIRNYKDVVGILPVHLYGQSCDMDEILESAKRYKLFVLEDVAQAFGGSWKNQKLGSIGTAGAFSFFPSKNLGGFGDGGMISTDDDEIAELACILRRHGGRDKNNSEHIGYNARLDTLQAAVLCAKFKHIDELNQKREEVASLYRKNLKSVKELIIPQSNQHVYHQYTVQVPIQERDGLQLCLRNKGIYTAIYYPKMLCEMYPFKDRSAIFYPLINASIAARTVLSLPIGPFQKKEDTIYIADCIKEYFKKK